MRWTLRGLRLDESIGGTGSASGDGVSGVLTARLLLGSVSGWFWNSVTLRWMMLFARD
jgi:hypothetical protein